MYDLNKKSILKISRNPMKSFSFTQIEVSKAEREKLKAEKEEHMAELERKKRERAARFGTGPSTEVVAQEEER